jgi:hypothetical protein
MSWLDPFAGPMRRRARATLSFVLLVAAACADDGATAPHRAPAPRASADVAPSDVGGPIIYISTPDLTFARQPVGTSSAAQTVVVANGGGGLLYLSLITTTAPFAQTNNCPYVLAGYDSCTINVVYTPTAAGTQYGWLSIVSNASSGGAGVSLTGSAFVPTPALSVTPGSIGFGTLYLGTATSGRVVKITSTGNVPVVISSATLGGANPGDFGIWNDGCSGATLAPGASCTLYVSFEPLRTGTRTATVTIAHNAAGSPSLVSLSGAGAKPPGGIIP